MARKDPKDMTVEEKLKTLFQLQTTLSHIDEKRAVRGELPLEVEDLENELEGLSVRMEKLNKEIRDLKDAISKRSADIEQAKMSVERYKDQLNEVKNNREYDTLTKEIEFPCTYHLIVVGVGLSLAQTDACFAVIANSKLKLVQILTLGEPGYC